MTFIYPAIFSPKEDEKGYRVTFPDLACCETEGLIWRMRWITHPTLPTTGSGRRWKRTTVISRRRAHRMSWSCGRVNLSAISWCASSFSRIMTDRFSDRAERNAAAVQTDELLRHSACAYTLRIDSVIRLRFLSIVSRGSTMFSENHFPM